MLSVHLNQEVFLLSRQELFRVDQQELILLLMLVQRQSEYFQHFIGCV